MDGLPSHRELQQLMTQGRWRELRDLATKAISQAPTVADFYGYLAHAHRQLGDGDAAWSTADAGLKVDPTNLFCLNRLSLAGALTGRFEQVIARTRVALDRVPANEGDRQNLAIIITNAIYAYSHLGRAAEAVHALTPTIERLDHPDLHFNSACLFALANDERAFGWMRKSLAAGKDKQSFADADFDVLRDDPRFDALLAREWALEAQALARANTTDRALLRPEHFLDPQRFELRPVDRPPAREPALEAAIAVTPEDPNPYAVYADWLEEREDPRGTGINLSLACARAQTEDERMLAFVRWARFFERHAPAFLGPLVELREAHATWRHGSIERLELQLDADQPVELEPLVREVLEHPSATFLTTLEVGDLPSDGVLDYQPVLRALQATTPRCLRHLTIEPRELLRSSAQLSIAELTLPRLESLTLGGGTIELGALPFPSLRRFALRTTAFTHAHLEALLAAPLPQLESLELWFGSRSSGADRIDPGDLDALARHFPNVRHLGLRNAPATDTFVEWLLGAPLSAQLESLDLSLGTFSDDGARLLLEHAPRLPALRRLSVAQSCLGPVMVRRLQLAFAHVDAGDQKSGRFVSVAE